MSITRSTVQYNGKDVPCIINKKFISSKTSNIEIDISAFNDDRDILKVYIGERLLKYGYDYMISSDKSSISNIKGYWNENNSGITVTFVLINYIDIPSIGDGTVADGSVNINKLDKNLKDKVNKIDIVSSQLDEMKNKDDLMINITNTDILVGVKTSKTKDLRYRFSDRCTNGIWQFYGFYEEPNVEAYPNTNNVITFGTTRLTDIVVDWLSPFMVKAKNNGDGDYTGNPCFTSGNHIYGGGGGSAIPDITKATSRNVGLKITVDGVNATSVRNILYGSKIEIQTIHRVQGYNTVKSVGGGREILEVLTKYSITKENGMTISVRLKAMEDISLERWYGFILALAGQQGISANVTFNGTGTISRYYTFNSTDINVTDVQAHSIVVNNKDGNYEYKLIIDNLEGVGNYVYKKDSSQPYGQITQWNKIYTHLVNALPDTNYIWINQCLSYTSNLKVTSI